MKEEICQAIFKDLGRDPFLNEVYEANGVAGDARWNLAHVDEHMADISTETELINAPGSTTIRYEPLGVCAVYGAWNYPFSLTMQPLV